MLSGEKLGTLKVQLTSEIILKNVQQILGRQGIRVIVLKGPFLGCTLYADPLERTYCDLDLLVKPQEFQRAAALLMRRGFKLVPGKPSRAATEKEFYNCALVSPLGVRVELHRDLSGYGRYRVNVEEMFTRAVRFRMGKVEGLGFCPEDLLLHLCIHILKSYLLTIEEKHLHDIARLVGRQQIDWHEFLTLSSRAGSKIGTYYILEAVKRQYGALVPDTVLTTLKPNGLRKLWLDRHLNPDTFPVYKYNERNILAAQIRLGLPLIDEVRDWGPLLLRYALVRLKDAVLWLLPIKTERRIVPEEASV